MAKDFTSPQAVSSNFELGSPFVKKVTRAINDGKDNLLKVGDLPADGTYPTGTTRFEKRNIAIDLPKWDSEMCIQCGNCAFVCPHASIRAKFFHNDYLVSANKDFPWANVQARGFPETTYNIQLFPEDCTACGLCVEACPEVDPKAPSIKAINRVPKMEIFEKEKTNLSFFEKLPYNDRSKVDFSNVRGIQFLQPLFEFSSACAGCGETPYLKVLSQLFGDRMLVANATGCSSIYGGNLPTTPWAKNENGKGPAWGKQSI